MTRPALPRLVDQTRLLLWTQTWLLLAGILLFMLVLEALSAHGPTEAAGALGVLLCTLLGAPILTSLSAKFFRHGWAVGWVLALVAELNAAFLLYAATAFGLYFGVAALVFVGLAAWVTVNLFRADVRRFFFSRSRVTAEERTFRA